MGVDSGKLVAPMTRGRPRPTFDCMRAIRPAPILVGDAPGIDFLNTIATLVDVPVEWLKNGEDLLHWLDYTKLVSAPLLANFRRASLPGELDATAAQARALREWFRGLVHRYKGNRLRPENLRDISPLNQVLERDEAYIQIAKPERENSAKQSPLNLRTTRRWRSAESLLIPIAEAMAELVCDEDFVHIKSCEGPTCTLLFLDRTHGRGRRWCSMAVCGNRTKQAAHRKRQSLRPNRSERSQSV
jgi:predicted RNA-binding Zn ribbon-like protein